MSATKVLIVDDNAPVLKSTSRLFRATGCDVFLAAGAREALEVARTQQPLDLVVSDIEMPDMRGTDLVREIGRISPATIHVLMTGAQIDPKALPEGVTLVHKPFSIEELLVAARAAVERLGQLRSDYAHHQQQFQESHARYERLKCVLQELENKMTAHSRTKPAS